MAHSIIHVIILLGGVQGIVFGLLHGLRPTPLAWSRFLGWALFSHALSDVYLWLYWSNTGVDIGLLRLLPLNVVLLPVYFLFRYSQNFANAERAYPKFSLILALAACFEVVIYLLPAGAAIFEGTIDQSILSFSKSIRTVLTIGSLPFVLTTGILLNRIIRQYRLSTARLLTHQYQIAWLYQLLFGLSLVYILAQLPLVVSFATGFSSRILYYPLGLVSVIFLVQTGIRAFSIHERIQSDEPTASIAGERPSAAQNLYRQAIHLIEAGKLYKQPTLKLADVSEPLSVSSHYLSRIVNQQAHKNFTDLINEYRVEEVKRLMNDPAFGHYTLEGLGREAGFGAKSTYQASFKRLTGMTPSQYRDQHRPAY